MSRLRALTIMLIENRAGQLNRRRRLKRLSSAPKPSLSLLPVCMIMSRILSAVLRQSILAGRTKVLAGALRIECIELSLTWFYGD